MASGLASSANSIARRTGRVDEDPCADHELPANELILDPHGAQAASAALFEINDPSIIQRLSTGLDKRFHQRNLVSRVIELAVCVADRANKMVSFESRQPTERLACGEKMAWENAGGTRNPIVKLEACLIVSCVRPAKARDQELHFLG